MYLTSEIYEKLFLELARDEMFKAENPIKLYGDSDQVAVIIDPRFDELMEGVIRNFMYFMNPLKWNLCIVSYSGHEAKIRATFPNCVFIKIADDIIEMDASGNPNISIHNYNRLLLNPDIYKALPASKIAIFQKDCVMYRMFPDYFAQVYGFAGANYYQPMTTYYGGINGGFSLRHRDTMLECLSKVSLDQVRETFPAIPEFIKAKKLANPGYSETMNEDIFFTAACEILRIPVPDIFHRTFLSVEIDVNHHTSVHHGWTKNYHPPQIVLEILSKSSLWSKYMDTVLRRLSPSQPELSAPFPTINATFIIH